jgi:ABC-type transport system involved in multi-copper enzyme maturation permease subunit
MSLSELVVRGVIYLLLAFSVGALLGYITRKAIQVVLIAVAISTGLILLRLSGLLGEKMSLKETSESILELVQIDTFAVELRAIIHQLLTTSQTSATAAKEFSITYPVSALVLFALFVVFFTGFIKALNPRPA